MINAETELLAAKINFERVTREKLPDFENLNEKIILNLPNSLNSSLELSSLNNLNLLISKINHEIAIKKQILKDQDYHPRLQLRSLNLKIKILVHQLMKKMMKL